MTTSPKLTGSRCRCSACNEHFNSTGAFDAHRTGKPGVDRRCRSVTEMAERGMVRNAAGFWITGARPDHFRRALSVTGDASVAG
jgi:hypothetical protein